MKDSNSLKKSSSSNDIGDFVKVSTDDTNDVAFSDDEDGLVKIITKKEQAQRKLEEEENNRLQLCFLEECEKQNLNSVISLLKNSKFLPSIDNILALVANFDITYDRKDILTISSKEQAEKLLITDKDQNIFSNPKFIDILANCLLSVSTNNLSSPEYKRLSILNEVVQKPNPTISKSNINESFITSKNSTIKESSSRS